MDLADYVKIGKTYWCTLPGRRGSQYLRTNKGLFHRFVTGAEKGQFVDHIDGDTFNNTRSNLRVVTMQQNNCNVRRVSGGTSKYRGVSKIAGQKKPWRVCLNSDKKNIYYGVFETEDEAALAYNEKAFELRGEYAYQNKIIN